jgi:hypothetical protein
MLEAISGILESWDDSLIEFTEVYFSWTFRISILKKDIVSNSSLNQTSISFSLEKDNIVIFTIIGPAERIGPSIMLEAISGILESWDDSLIEFTEVYFSWAFRISILKESFIFNLN